jgi:hypothetical protein
MHGIAPGSAGILPAIKSRLEGSAPSGSLKRLPYEMPGGMYAAPTYGSMPSALNRSSPSKIISRAVTPVSVVPG